MARGSFCGTRKKGTACSSGSGTSFVATSFSVAGERFDGSGHDDWLDSQDDAQAIGDVPWQEALGAALVLQFADLLEVQQYSGKFLAKITPTGHRLLQDPATLARELPITAAEDEAAHAAVAADALDALIDSVESLLARRRPRIGSRGAAEPVPLPGPLLRLGRQDLRHAGREYRPDIGRFLSADRWKASPGHRCARFLAHVPSAPSRGRPAASASDAR